MIGNTIITRGRRVPRAVVGPLAIAFRDELRVIGDERKLRVEAFEIRVNFNRQQLFFEVEGSLGPSRLKRKDVVGKGFKEARGGCKCPYVHELRKRYKAHIKFGVSLW